MLTAKTTKFYKHDKLFELNYLLGLAQNTVPIIVVPLLNYF